jgi:hypothetical protein
MFKSLANTFFGCAHSHTTFPMKRSPRTGPMAAQNSVHGGSYVVCLDCGTEFVYDWTTMRVGSPIEMRVTAAPVAAVPQPLREAQPMFR